MVLVEKGLLVDIQFFLDLRLKLFGDKEGLHMPLESSKRVFVSLKAQRLVELNDAFPNIFVRDLKLIYLVRKLFYFGQEKVLELINMFYLGEGIQPYFKLIHLGGV